MAVKFSLNPNPTFTADVDIPVHGGGTGTINFTFKHKARDDFKAFLENLAERDDVSIILDIASGWGLEEKFNKENIESLTQNYIGSSRAILNRYINEMTGVRQGN